MIGERIDHYHVLDRIGEGGMGSVYRAHDTLLERDVALKVLRGEFTGQPEVAARFRAEAVTLARLSHPHIATLYGLIRHGDQVCMVMEYVRGDTLDRLVSSTHPMPCERAVSLAAQMLDALDYAHGMGVVHRDIKPANLIVGARDHVKLMDFGIARVLGSGRVTQFGRTVGTLEYMPPEQIRGEDIDGRADLYAVGVVLYELVTGKLPFSVEGDVALMYAHLQRDAPPPRSWRSDVPSALNDAILRALAKKPRDRFASARAFREALANDSYPRVVSAPSMTSAPPYPNATASSASAPTSAAANAWRDIKVTRLATAAWDASISGAAYMTRLAHTSLDNLSELRLHLVRALAIALRLCSDAIARAREGTRHLIARGGDSQRGATAARVDVAGGAEPRGAMDAAHARSAAPVPPTRIGDPLRPAPSATFGERAGACEARTPLTRVADVIRTRRMRAVALGAGVIVLVAAGMMSFRAVGQIDRPVRADVPAGVVAVPSATAAPANAGAERAPLSPAPAPKPEDPRDALPPLAPPPGGLAPEGVKRGVAPERLTPDSLERKNGESRSRTPRVVTPPKEDEPEAAPSPVVTREAETARAAAFADVTFEGLHLVTGFDDDNDAEEADAHLVVHADRFTIVDDDAEKVAHEIHFGAPSANRSGQATLSGRVGLLNGSEIWLILPASTGRVVLRVDRDDATQLAREIERRLGTAVTWTLGELTRTP